MHYSLFLRLLVGDWYKSESVVEFPQIGCRETRNSTANIHRVQEHLKMTNICQEIGTKSIEYSLFRRSNAACTVRKARVQECSFFRRFAPTMTEIDLHVQR